MLEEGKVTGGCCCGSVRYRVKGPLRNIVNCHCSICLRLHGNFGPYTRAFKKDISILKKDGLAWYVSSKSARRGFCRQCGASLFWDPVQQDSMSISAGSLDDSAGLKVIGHIFVSEKPGFYEIADDLRQFEMSSMGALDGGFR